MATKKKKKAGRKAIGKEIKRMKRHGKKQDQAVAIALSEARSGKLGKGAKRAAGKKKKKR